MPLIAELIRQLDKAPGIDSLVKVFTVQNGDATQLTAALQDLFGADAGTLGTSVGAANAAGLPPSTASGESSLVPLRFSTDIRTNSIIASGSAEDLEVVESILLRLDSEGFAERITEVIWLRHQTAGNVAAAITSYVQQRTQTVNTIQQFQQGLGPFDLPDRDLIVVAEEASNSLLLSVSPRLYEEVRRMIDQLDRRAPMVMIKVMIAEVRLDDQFEIGGEVGLQDSLLYDRGIAAGAFPGATPPSIPPGFDWNGNGLGYGLDAAGLPAGNSFGQGNAAARGLSNFGVGTTSSNLGYGGFVLSAASDSVSLLLRTLQDAQRLQVISRPQITTMDNTDGFVQVGDLVARVTGVINNGVAGTQVVTQDVEVGLILRVRPRVGADGLIVMDIDATRSEVDENNGTPIPTGGIDGGVVIIQNIRQTTAQSTVAAYSGQTVVFGGLIQKVRANISRRVPIVADIPILGHMFKYDVEIEGRTELLVIMTPMLVTGEEDLDYIKEVESSRMSWCLADVVEAHGDVGLSGGNGLWGPAMGNTIYPDLQPTIENVIIHDSYPSQDAGLPMGQGPTMIESGGSMAPTQAPAVGAPVAPINAEGILLNQTLPLNQTLDVPAMPEVGSTSQAYSPQALPEMTGLLQTEMFPQLINDQTRNLPASATMPQSNFSLPKGTDAMVKPSVYPVPPKGPATARQTSWTDVQLRSSSPQQQAISPTSPALGPKPIRLGSGDRTPTDN